MIMICGLKIIFDVLLICLLLYTAFQIRRDSKKSEEAFESLIKEFEEKKRKYEQR